jgi:prevent-host-death family protein
MYIITLLVNITKPKSTYRSPERTKAVLEAIPATEARHNLLPLLTRIEKGAFSFSVTRHGRPIAVVLSYEDYQRMSETLRFMESQSFSQRLCQGLSEAHRGELTNIDEVPHG